MQSKGLSNRFSKAMSYPRIGPLLEAHYHTSIAIIILSLIGNWYQNPILTAYSHFSLIQNERIPPRRLNRDFRPIDSLTTHWANLASICCRWMPVSPFCHRFWRPPVDSTSSNWEIVPISQKILWAPRWVLQSSLSLNFLLKSSFQLARLKDFQNYPGRN